MIMIQNNNPMNMIRHYHKYIGFNIWCMILYFMPHRIDDNSCFRQDHFYIQGHSYFFKKQRLWMPFYGDLYFFYDKGYSN